MIIYLTQNRETIIDDDPVISFPVLSYSWHYHHGYARTSICISKKNKIYKHIYLHRLILELKGISIFESVDHINRNKLDNRFENLRPCTHAQNNMNREAQSNNKLGITGVWKDNERKYRAQISFEGKQIPLGAYRNLQDAVAIRKNVEQKLFGEFAPLVS